MDLRAFLLPVTVLIAPLGIAAWAPAPADMSAVEPVPVVGPQSVPYSSSVDAAACAASGGYVDARGRGQFETCVHPYADAGKSCTDNQQCDGKCITEADSSATTGITGQCQADDALFGCYAEVVDGRPVRAICVD